MPLRYFNFRELLGIVFVNKKIFEMNSEEFNLEMSEIFSQAGEHEDFCN